MFTDKINKEQKSEITDAVRKFASLPPEKQEVALLILRGIQIGEDIAKREPISA